MKVFVFGDIHAGTARYKQIEEQQDRVWQWVIDNVKKYSCDMVFFLGDRFKSRDPEGIIRDRSDSGLIQLVKEVPVIAICGNHDFYYKSSQCCNYGVLNDTVIKKLGLVIVDKHFEVEFDGKLIEFVAYGVKPRGVAEWLFMHDEVEGFSRWARGLFLHEIQSYRKVFGGHIHSRVEYKNVQYIGVPFQQGFTDTEPCGGCILDIGTGQIQWIDFPDRVRFIYLDDLFGITNLRNCVIRTVKAELSDRMMELGALNVEVIWEKEENVNNDNGGMKVQDDLNWDDVIKEYLSIKNKDIDGDYFKYAKDIMNKVMEKE